MSDFISLSTIAMWTTILWVVADELEEYVVITGLKSLATLVAGIKAFVLTIVVYLALRLVVLNLRLLGEVL